MRILVTGAAGFIGSRVASKLANAEVFALDRPDADRARLDALAPHVTFVPCALESPGALEETIAELRPEACVHLAWYAVPGKYLHAAENLEHLQIAMRLARALESARCNRLVTAGTCFEYDTDIGLLSETTRCHPRQLYSACKLSMFQVLREYCAQIGMRHAHVRFFYQYGPWEQPGRLVPSLIDALLARRHAPATSGRQIRDFLHIDDVGSAVAAVVASDLDGAINIGSGVPVSVQDVARAVERACDAPGLVDFGALADRPGDPAFICADVTKLRSTGWAPAFTLDAGIADTVAWNVARQR